MRVCYFGVYNTNYPRNRVLREGLTHHGVEVTLCNVSRKLSARQRAQALVEQFQPEACDVILVGEFANTLALTAWRLARRYNKRLIFDVFTSAYNTLVEDRQGSSRVTVKALWYWLSDKLALTLSDHAIVDTAPHADHFARQFKVPRHKITAIPVGAPSEWLDEPPAASQHEGVLVQFYGTYIPLHGVGTIIKAARFTADNIHFELIGRGQTYDSMRTMAAGIPSITFRDTVQPDALPAEASRADISLGIFGMTHKAQLVVPNKVYQTMALGNPVITADTPAIRGLFSAGEVLVTVPAGDAAALAEAITHLAHHAGERQRLGQNAYEVIRARYSPAVLGQRLLEVLTA